MLHDPALRTHSELSWHRGLVAAPLLADIASNPPRRVRRLAPLSQVFAGGGETVLTWDRNDDRVDALGMLADQAFRDLEAKTDTQTARLVPSLDDVIDAAVAGQAVTA
jgi:uncharacterized protein YjiS (DUF1127 family)